MQKSASKICPSKNNNKKNCTKKIINEMNDMEWQPNNKYFEKWKFLK